MRTTVRNTPGVRRVGTVLPVGRRIDLDDLVGAAEIAERLGLASRRLVHDWRRRDVKFPLPVKELGSAHIWDWREVEQWAVATGRLPK